MANGISFHAFEQWMVKSNIRTAREVGLDRVVATLRANGYNRVAAGVQTGFVPKICPGRIEMTAEQLLALLTSKQPDVTLPNGRTGLLQSALRESGSGNTFILTVLVDGWDCKVFCRLQ